MAKPPENLRTIDALLEIMALLRDPERGCAWDLEQDFATIAPYTIEEAYEVADAIERGDLNDLKGELGDLLLQVVFHAQMAREEGVFTFADVVESINDKMIRRHPHVFESPDGRNAQQQTEAWERQKAEERAAKAKAKGDEDSVFDDLPVSLPASTRAAKIQRRLSRVGFDWPDTAGLVEKIVEEAKELTEAEANGSPSEIEDEFGDVMFALVNLANRLDVDPEAALRRANEKVMRRFRFVEQRLREAGKSPSADSLDEMEALWQDAKRAE